jgi:DNA-directed RNA polymerase subunit E"
MAKSKACRICNTIYHAGEICPKCGASEYTDNYKGRIVVLDAEKSEIAKEINLKDKGDYAIKTR